MFKFREKPYNLERMRKYSKYIIAIICLSIVVFRIVFPKLNFDIISLSLITIATLILLIKEPENILNNARKIKFGSFELELEVLNKDVKKLHEKIITKKHTGLSRPIPKIFNESENNYRTEILKVADNVEKELREVYQKLLKTNLTESISVFMVIEKLREEDFIDYETSETIRKFFNTRNQVVHNKYNIGKKELTFFTEVSQEMLVILKLIKKTKGLKHYGLS